MHALALGMGTVLCQPEVLQVVEDAHVVASLLAAAPPSLGAAVEADAHAVGVTHPLAPAHGGGGGLVSLHACVAAFAARCDVLRGASADAGSPLLGPRAGDVAGRDGRPLLPPGGAARLACELSGDAVWQRAWEVAGLLQPFVDVAEAVGVGAEVTLADAQRYWLHVAQGVQRRLGDDASVLSAGACLEGKGGAVAGACLLVVRVVVVVVGQRGVRGWQAPQVAADIQRLGNAPCITPCAPRNTPCAPCTTPCAPRITPC
eukprot:353681-Chlamydomonas_euryale.AAC.1